MNYYKPYRKSLMLISLFEFGGLMNVDINVVNLCTQASLTNFFESKFYLKYEVLFHNVKYTLSPTHTIHVVYNILDSSAISSKAVA